MLAAGILLLSSAEPQRPTWSSGSCSAAWPESAWAGSSRVWSIDSVARLPARIRSSCWAWGFPATYGLTGAREIFSVVFVIVVVSVLVQGLTLDTAAPRLGVVDAWS